MKVIQLYEKIGKCMKLEDGSTLGDYCFSGEYGEDDSLLFKDEESFEKFWNKPCYVPSVEFSDNGSKYVITDEYETHKTLLEKCNYNEKMCRCMFERLNWQSPETWLSELDEEDYSYFYDFVKAGNKVFLHEQPFARVPMQYGKVNRILHGPEGLTLDTKVYLDVQDILGETWTIETYLHELSETDIKLKIAKWGK